MAGVIYHDTLAPDIETASEGYARRFAGPLGEYLLGVQDELVQELLAPYRGQIRRVLDVGGGHGQLAELLLANGFEVWVHGSNEACAKRLQPLIERFGDRLRFAVSSLWALPFDERSFDLITGVRLLAHVERWQALLAEMSRVSNRFILVDFAPWASANILEPILFRLKRRAEGNTRPFFCYWSSQIADVLRAEGFSRQTRQKEFFAPMVVHRFLNRPNLSRGMEAAFRALGLTGALGSPVLLLAERPWDEPTATCHHRDPQ